MKIVITPKKEKGIYAINTGKRLFSAKAVIQNNPIHKKNTLKNFFKLNPSIKAKKIEGKPLCKIL